MPLCPECISEHTQYHEDQRSRPQYATIHEILADVHTQIVNCVEMLEEDKCRNVSVAICRVISLSIFRLWPTRWDRKYKQPRNWSIGLLTNHSACFKRTLINNYRSCTNKRVYTHYQNHKNKTSWCYSTWTSFQPWSTHSSQIEDYPTLSTSSGRSRLMSTISTPSSYHIFMYIYLYQT